MCALQVKPAVRRTSIERQPVFEHEDVTPERRTPAIRRGLSLVGALVLMVCAIVVWSLWDESQERRIRSCDATTFAQLEQELGRPDGKYGEKSECWQYKWSDGCRVWCSRDGTNVEEHKGFHLCNLVE
jgi:hypothetical protein